MRKRELIPVGVEALWLVPLTKGYFAVVDDRDAELVARHNWKARECRRADGTVRAVYAETSVPGTNATLSMHRMIAGADAPMVDHVDGDGLNNTRANLRPCSDQTNQANRRKSAGMASAFKGVGWSSRRSRWRANLKVDGVKRHLGYFDDEREAAQAYDNAAIEAFGSYARTNFVFA